MAEKRTEELFNLGASYQFVIERIRANGGAGLGRCSVCDASTWVAEAVYRDGEEPSEVKETRAPAYLYKSSFSFWSISPSVPLLALTCANCGHMRLHNLAWIKSQMEMERDRG